MSLYFFTLFYIILILTSIIGFSYIFLSLQNRFFKSKNCFDILVISPISGHIDDIEMHIRKIRHLYFDRNPIILFVDFGLDDETKYICNKLIFEFDNCMLCDYNNLNFFLNNLF